MNAKNLILSLLLMMLATSIFAQSIGINANGTTPDPSAMLDVSSTSKGMLIPRMTSAARNAIASPARGLLVFDTNTDDFWYFDGITWKQISPSATLPASLEDADADTKIQVEESSDEDIIRMDAAGKEVITIDSSMLKITNLNLLARGDFEPTTVLSLPDSGTGTRMMWIPGLSAFRAGTVDSSDWNRDSIGLHSVVMGLRSKALGAETSVFGGRDNHVDGTGSSLVGVRNGYVRGSFSIAAGGFNDSIRANHAGIIGGFQSKVFGDKSVIAGGELNSISDSESFIGGGDSNEANGTETFIGGGFSNLANGGGAFIAAGVGNVADGWRSFTTGINNSNPSYAESVFGTHSINYTASSSQFYVSTDRLFTIGNGISPTDRSNALTMLKNGNTCLGCAAPGNSKLKIKQTVTGGGNVGGLNLENSTGANWEFFVFANGVLSLYYNGNLRGTFSTSSGAYSATSDRKLKTNIKPLESVMGRLVQLKPSSYHYKSDPEKRNHIGMIAQELEPLFPELVTAPAEGEQEAVYTVDYSGFGILAIKAIQEQQEMIKRLEARIAALENN
ncbi:MAG: tail fiber domain-containing protein [Bacteroidia bacterium]|nr:tail fiber domain-containing protein [Bacteroidia bacterium]